MKHGDITWDAKRIHILKTLIMALFSVLPNLNNEFDILPFFQNYFYNRFREIATTEKYRKTANIREGSPRIWLTVLRSNNRKTSGFWF